MSAKKKLLYIFTKAPYSNASGQEGLDAALIGASFDQEISVLFVHDGVFQLKTEQRSDADIKVFTKTYRALQDFGVESVYVHDLALLARGINDDELMIDCETLDVDAVRTLVKQQDRVLTF